MATPKKGSPKPSPIRVKTLGKDPFPRKVAMVIAVEFDGTQTVYKPASVNFGRLQPGDLKRVAGIQKITASSWVSYRVNPFCVAYISSDGAAMRFCMP